MVFQSYVGKPPSSKSKPFLKTKEEKDYERSLQKAAAENEIETEPKSEPASDAEVEAMLQELALQFHLPESKKQSHRMERREAGGKP